jgi:hypothetical protein
LPRLFASASGSACAANVAPGVQKSLQASQPLPVSRATKNLPAISVIDDVVLPLNVEQEAPRDDLLVAAY